MDNSPAQPVQQVPSQHVPIQEPPQKKINLRKFVNIGAWMFLFIFLPITVLIFLSQNSLPGESFYPVKRSFENVILAAASVSPVTRAAFRTDLADRRFSEAEKLLLASSNTEGLTDFVEGIQTAQTEVSAIENPVKKQELQQKIQVSVIEYEKKLDLVKEKLVARQETRQLAIVPTITQFLSSSANTPTPVPTSISAPEMRLPTSTLAPTLPVYNTPTPTPTLEPKQVLILTPTPIPFTSTEVPTLIPTLIPTSTPTLAPTTIPTSIPTPALTQKSEEETIEEVNKVQAYLRCLRTTRPPHRECAQPEMKSEKQTERKQKIKERGS